MPLAMGSLLEGWAGTVPGPGPIVVDAEAEAAERAARATAERMELGRFEHGPTIMPGCGRTATGRSTTTTTPERRAPRSASPPPAALRASPARRTPRSGHSNRTAAACRESERARPRKAYAYTDMRTMPASSGRSIRKGRAGERSARLSARDMIELHAALNAPSGSFFETALSGIADGYGYDSSGTDVTMPGDVEQEDHIPREEVGDVGCHFPGSEDTLTVSLSALRRHLAAAVEGETARHPGPNRAPSRAARR